MAKLVVLSEGMTGQSYELKVDKTTVGRVDDNTFQIPQSSVSSHHCEVLLRGSDIVIKDLNSTNGTFINNEPVKGEAILKAGQVLRLGEIEMRLETGAPTNAGGVIGASSKKTPIDSTMVIHKGVKMDELEKGPQGLDTTKGVFTKKTNPTQQMVHRRGRSPDGGDRGGVLDGVPDAEQALSGRARTPWRAIGFLNIRLFQPFNHFAASTAAYVIRISAPARRIDSKLSNVTARSSIHPSFAAALIMEYSALTA